MSRMPDQNDPSGKADRQQVAPKPERATSAQGESQQSKAQRASLQAQLAHELKTPVSAIAAAADIMRNEQFGPLANDKYKTYAVDIYASAMFTLAVIDRMLNTEQAVEQARVNLEVSNVDLTMLANEIVSAMQPLAQASNITLSGPSTSAVEPPKECVIRADEISVKQITTNLLANAIKFTSHGGHVTLNVTETSDGGACMSVTDDGAGMTAAQIASALSGEKVPAEASTATRRGLGMGLPLVRILADANGAQLVINSDGPGTGTRVEIQFPPARPSP